MMLCAARLPALYAKFSDPPQLPTRILNICLVPTYVQKELLDLFASNVHRIDKDVHRCDRNHPYFSSRANLDKLRSVMCT